jgi:hypothetical protein
MMRDRTRDDLRSSGSHRVGQRYAHFDAESVAS